MKGVTVEKAGEELKLVDYLERPKPGPDQILVKSLYTAINPVELRLHQRRNLMLTTDLEMATWLAPVCSSLPGPGPWAVTLQVWLSKLASR